MPSFQTSRRVNHSPADMFQLVANVAEYPKFVPLCQSIKVLKRETFGNSEIIIARMTVAYKLFSESFTSRVRLRQDIQEILVDYLDGPFRKMENRWTFSSVGDEACQVGFFLDYEFKSRTLQMLMGAVFDRAFRKFADAFEARADEVYGKRSGTQPQSVEMSGT